MYSIDLHMIQSYLLRIVLDSKMNRQNSIFTHVIYEAKGL